jgi:hypothetical protein
MAFTINQLNALEAAIGTGELSVKYDGKEIQYRSTADLMKAYEFVKGQLMATGIVAMPALSNRGPAALTSFSRD